MSEHASIISEPPTEPVPPESEQVLEDEQPLEGESQRDMAHRLIAKALTGSAGTEGIEGAFWRLQFKLRQSYARQLTGSDKRAVLDHLRGQVEMVEILLGNRAEFRWPDN